VAIRGYIGPSPDKGSVRIHHDLDFSSYTEVPKSAIQHVEPVDPHRPNSPTVALVSAEAPVRHVRQTARTDEAGFLAGGIAASQLRGSQASSCTDTIVQPSTDTCCCPVTNQPPPPGPPPGPPHGPQRPQGPGDDSTDTCCCPSTLTTTEGY